MNKMLPGKTLLLGSVALVTLSIPAAVAAQSRDDGAGRNIEISPYLEVEQILVADLDSDGDVLTYTTAAAGLDASIASRNAAAQVSVRYERRFFYEDGFSDEDYISGVARGSVQVVPGHLQLDAGALATQTAVDVRGGQPVNNVGNLDSVTQVYSVYAGPSFQSNVGPLQVNANYQAGYTKVEAKDPGLVAGQQPIDTFDESISQSAGASIGMQPGDLPFGWSVSGGWEREDADQLDQRFEGKYARADVTVPVSRTIAAVGGVGYEDIEISERDALRDVNGDPVREADGRLVTDENSPRLLSYDQDGVYWDVGVMWRPSRRTSLEARVGERYDSTTYYGSFSYQPDSNSSIGVSVYDSVTGFGSLLNDRLAGLGTEFETTRNPLGGNLTGCALGQGNALCYDDALQSALSSNFRARGVTGTYSTQKGPWGFGLAAGYQEREYFAAATGALAGIDGITDKSYFAAVSAGRQLDERSDINGNVYANYSESGLAGAPGALGLGANMAYSRQIVAGLSGTAAAGIDYFEQDGTDSDTTASALVGLRYDF